MNGYKGLSYKEVILNRKKYGSNEVSEHKKSSLLSFLIESLNDPIIKILLVALGIKLLFFLGDSDIYETLGIIVAIILATVISSLSEYGSEKAFEKLSNSSSKIDVKVIRNSKLESIGIDEVVVGDLLYLESGDKIGADGVVIKDKIAVDESMLTGEAKEQYKYKDNKVYRGSIVLSGSAIMKVESVGDNTFYGKIAKDIQEKSPESPLKNRLRNLAKLISKIGYICAFLVILSYLFSVVVIKNDFEWVKIVETITSFKVMAPHLLYSLTLGITIIVVAVPEGLPMMITLVLSSNMKRLLKNNVLVRKLVGIESAGSLNILFSDKTGTITKGKLEVNSFVDYKGNVYKKYSEVPSKIKELLYLSLVYNNASTINNKEVIGGNTTDRAIISYVHNSDRDKYTIISKSEFDSAKKYSSVKLNYEDNLEFFKGAYEIIIKNCKYFYRSDAAKGYINNINDLIDKGNNYTAKGFRVLALATGRNFNELCFLGFILIKDEIRKEAIEGIKLVQEAGIQTVMITGDNKLTATNIASEVGLIKDDKDLVLTSEELNKMSDENLKKILPNIRVIARSLPEDKKRLVRISQELNLVVGMTGDGVNDAPALKRADVGFAMGSGSEVAKEVSDIIILDDNFQSITKTILFGRTIFKSIRKFIIFQLSVNITAVSLSVIGPLIGIVAPVTVVQMLWINMIMDTLAGVAYAYEPPLLEYMKEKPKKREENIMNKYMMNEILITGCYMSFICMLFLKSEVLQSFYRIGENNKYVMSAFFGLFIFICVFNAFNARTYRLNVFDNVLKNKVFVSVIVFIILVQLFMIYFGGSIFRTTGLSFIELDITLLLAFSVIPFDILRKIIIKKLGKPRNL